MLILLQSQVIYMSRLVCTDKQQSLPQPLEFLQYASQELDPVFLKGEKNPSSKQEKDLLHIMRQTSCSFLCLLRQKRTRDTQTGNWSSHLSCCMRFLAKRTFSFTMIFGTLKPEAHINQQLIQRLM